MYIKHASMQNEKQLMLPVFDDSLPFRVTAAGITYQNKNYRVHRPKSDVTVFDYIIKGEGTAIINNKTFHLKAGDTCFAMVNDDQLYYSNPDNPWVKIWICLQGPIPPAFIDAYNLRKYTVVHCDTERFLRETHVTLADKSLTISEITDKTTQIFLELLQFIYNNADRSGKPSAEAEIIKNHIDTHIYEPIKLEDLSQLIYKSNAHTIRIFKTAYGMTPYEYYTDNRIKKAIHLLQNSTFSVKEIAYSLGFTDEHYFSKIFKKKTGKRPSEYR